MVTQELLEYIKQSIKSGKSKETITSELLKTNWSEPDVTQAFSTIDQNIPVPQLPIQPGNPVPQHLDSQTHLIITIIAFLVCYPVGIICMWVWMKHWPKWVKILLTLPFIIIPLLAIFMGVVLIVINPSKQFALANNSKRQSDVNTILKAIDQYQADHTGKLPIDVSRTNEEIASGSGNADLCSLLVSQYLAALPADPLGQTSGQPIASCSTGYDTGYTISIDATNHVTISAPKAENGVIISAIR